MNPYIILYWAVGAGIIYFRLYVHEPKTEKKKQQVQEIRIKFTELGAMQPALAVMCVALIAWIAIPLELLRQMLIICNDEE
jgi:hypothetical protein